MSGVVTKQHSTNRCGHHVAEHTLARTSWEPVHTSQPLAGVCACPASHRATPRRPQNSRAEPQAYPGTRRTFHEPRGPPEVDAERACQGRAIQKPGVAPKPHRSAKASQGASSPAPAAPSPPQPGASVPRASAAAREPREPLHARQPLAGVRQPRPDAAHSRAEPEEPRRSAGTPQTRAAPSKSRAEPVGSARASGTVPKP